MKNFSFLVLLMTSAILFAIGISIPGRENLLHIIFVVVGTALGFMFYILTLLQVIRTPTLSPGRRVFWIVAIVCVPMIGNLIYIFIHDADTRKQIPKPEV